MLTKSGEDTLGVFKEILFDIDSIYNSETNEASQNILFHLRNTMSDRAATEMKFNNLLQTYRADIIPQMIDSWSDLDVDVQKQLTRMNNFFVACMDSFISLRLPTNH